MSKSEGASILDYLVALVTVLCALALLALPLRMGAFAEMYDDFGGELPFWTTLALRPFVPPILGVLVLAVTGLAIWQWKEPIRRKLILCGALVAGAGSLLGLLYALYLPIFELAGRVSSE
jgi:hypothetical protein